MCVLARFSFGNSVLLKEKSNNVSVERGVAARRAQMVWPMMTVTVTKLHKKCGFHTCLSRIKFLQKSAS